MGALWSKQGLRAMNGSCVIVPAFGLSNFGNTCYCNSVLQVLYACVPFRLAVLSWANQRAFIVHSKAVSSNVKNSKRLLASSSDARCIFCGNYHQGDDDQHPEALLLALANLFQEIQTQTTQSGIIRPRHFVQTLAQTNSMFRLKAQQDAHELLIFLLNSISDFLKMDQRDGSTCPFNKSDSPVLLKEPFESQSEKDSKSCLLRKTLVENIFQGEMYNMTKCWTCEKVTRREEFFFDLSIDVEPNTSISYALKRLMQPEKLTGIEKFYCEYCRGFQEAEKWMQIVQVPKILILHLKRFKYVDTYHEHYKLCHRVTYPVELRLASSEAFYYLFAIIIHQGSVASAGHYISCIRIRQSDQWILYDDARVIVLSSKQVFKDFYGCSHDENYKYNSKDHTSSYILFYENHPNSKSLSA